MNTDDDKALPWCGDSQTDDYGDIWCGVHKRDKSRCVAEMADARRMHDMDLAYEAGKEDGMTMGKPTVEELQRALDMADDYLNGGGCGDPECCGTRKIDGQTLHEMLERVGNG